MYNIVRVTFNRSETSLLNSYASGKGRIIFISKRGPYDLSCILFTKLILATSAKSLINDEVLHSFNIQYLN